MGSNRWDNPKTAVFWIVITMSAVMILTLFLTSCSHAGTESQPDRLHAAGSHSDITGIRITDTVEGKYRVPLDISLSEEEVDTFHSIMENHDEVPEGEVSQVQSRMGDYYCIHLLDKNGKEEAVWTVDLTHVLTDEDGNIMQQDPLLEQWMVDIEAAHGITYSSVLDRAPGQKYFSELMDADSAVLAEMPDKDRADLIHRDFSSEETSALAETISDAVRRFGCKNVQEKINTRWKLSLYNSGKLLYEFQMDDQGYVYENGFRIMTEKLDGIYKNLLNHGSTL